MTFKQKFSVTNVEIFGKINMQLVWLDLKQMYSLVKIIDLADSPVLLL